MYISIRQIRREREGENNTTYTRKPIYVIFHKHKRSHKNQLRSLVCVSMYQSYASCFDTQTYTHLFSHNTYGTCCSLIQQYTNIVHNHNEGYRSCSKASVKIISRLVTRVRLNRVPVLPKLFALKMQ